jgi:DNA-binding NarL/FixJ family response regulator
MSLGLDGDAERVYRALVACGSASASTLAATTGLHPDLVTAALVRLSTLALISASTDGTEHVAAPPAVALGQLVRDRRDELRQAELDLVLLAEAHRAAMGNRYAADVLEVITGADGVRHRFLQVQQSARRELRAFVLPNPTVVEAGEYDEEEQALNRGIDYRVIIDRRVLVRPGMSQQIAETVAAGEQIRVAESLPLKMVIADRDLALLPLAPDSGGVSALLVHASGLLEALVALFEAIWERSYPLLTISAYELAEGSTGAADELDRRILALLLAGLTDQAVAGQLDMSLRTVQRRIRALMELAGVQTRIQLGWAAARNDWA